MAHPLNCVSSKGDAAVIAPDCLGAPTVCAGPAMQVRISTRRADFSAPVLRFDLKQRSCRATTCADPDPGRGARPANHTRREGRQVECSRAPFEGWQMVLQRCRP